LWHTLDIKVPTLCACWHASQGCYHRQECIGHEVCTLKKDRNGVCVSHLLKVPLGPTHRVRSPQRDRNELSPLVMYAIYHNYKNYCLLLKPNFCTQHFAPCQDATFESPVQHIVSQHVSSQHLLLSYTTTKCL